MTFLKLPEITTSPTIYADDVQLLFSGSPNNLEQLKIYAETSLNTIKEWYSENAYSEKVTPLYHKLLLSTPKDKQFHNMQWHISVQ